MLAAGPTRAESLADACAMALRGDQGFSRFQNGGWNFK
jgi:hypothetical protein